MSLRLIQYNDSCSITRRTGSDEWDNDISAPIYDGECLYEEGGMSYTDKIGTKSPTVYLPKTDNLIAINDNITVTTEFGRVINAVVLNVRDIHLSSIVGETLTRLELKNAQGD